MIICSNLDRYHQISVLSPRFVSAKNKENLKSINQFYAFYGIKMDDVDSDLIEESFKGDTKCFYNNFSGDIDKGDISIIHDRFTRSLLFFQNNVKVHEVNLEEIDMTIYRTTIPLGFIKLCNFYLPKRIVTSTYTTKDAFNPDFPIIGKAHAIMCSVSNPDKKDDESWIYAKTINTMVEDYIISPEVISYNNKDKVQNIIDVYTKWIDGAYINLKLENKSITITDSTGSQNKIRL